MDLIKEMDLSAMPKFKQCGGKFYDEGEEMDVLDVMKNYDVDTIRICLWNDPWSKGKESYGAGENDLDTSLEIAKRATNAGFGVLLNFRYSDLEAEDLEKEVYSYTIGVLQQFLKNGVNVTMVQIGSELSNDLFGSEGNASNCANMERLINAGIRAVRKVDEKRLFGALSGMNEKCRELEKIPVMLYLDNGENNARYREWFNHFMESGEDFELIGLSYDPFRYGSLQMLNDSMNDIAQRYGKELLIADSDGQIRRCLITQAMYCGLLN